MNEFPFFLMRLLAAGLLGPAVVLLGFEIKKVFRKQAVTVNPTTLQTACEEILNLKGSVVINCWTLYQTSKGTYVIFRYNGNSDPIDDSEERFDATLDGRSDAISKFIRKVAA